MFITPLKKNCMETNAWEVYQKFMILLHLTNQVGLVLKHGVYPKY